MLEFEFNKWLLIWSVIGAITFIAALKFKAPYGRHISEKWGLQIDNKWGWFFMELPAVLIPLIYIYINRDSIHSVSVFILGFYILHYINRVFIFPFRLKTKGKKIPILIALFAAIFNLINGSIMGHYFTSISHLDVNWFTDIRFIIGVVIFFSGMYINHRSDTILINLRKPGETGYKIPKGFLFNKISCPNHFGEIVEWIGFAILSWSLPGLVFVIWTMANLVPRSLNHHDWYKDNFREYPKDRKAVIPFVV